MKCTTAIDYCKARLHFRDGRIEEFANQQLAHAFWLALPRGVQLAFRGVNDTRSVYSWDYVDAL